MNLEKSLRPDYEKHIIVRRRKFKWLNNEFQKETNSEFPLIDVEITPDYSAVQCPKCKSNYELTHQHLDYWWKRWHYGIQITTDSFWVVFICALGAIKVIEIIFELFNLWMLSF